MKKLSVVVISAGVIVLCFVVGYFIGCPIKLITGIPCPGCGMTRAFVALFLLDFKSAFYYHPLFPLVILIVLALLIIMLRYSHSNNKNILTLDGTDMHVLMKNLFSQKITIIVLGLYIAAFFLVFVLRFPHIP